MCIVVFLAISATVRHTQCTWINASLSRWNSLIGLLTAFLKPRCEEVYCRCLVDFLSLETYKKWKVLQYCSFWGLPCYKVCYLNFEKLPLFLQTVYADLNDAHIGKGAPLLVVEPMFKKQRKFILCGEARQTIPKMQCFVAFLNVYFFKCRYVSYNMKVIISSALPQRFLYELIAHLMRYSKPRFIRIGLLQIFAKTG